MRSNQNCVQPESTELKREPIITVDDDELELSEDEPKTMFDRCWYAVTKAGEAAGFDVPDIKSLEVENTVVDTSDLPRTWTLNSFIFYQCCFWALAAFFFTRNYLLCRTSTFISLDGKAGVCKGDSGSDTCCEVPTSITGDFKSDSFGRWNTFPKFNFNFNNYELSLIGAAYTNEEYASLMSKISKEVKAIGARGKNRDYSWNMVAWSSFTSINTDSGFFKFYLSGDAGIIFAKTIVGIGFASNTSSCSQPVAASINSATRQIDVRVTLCDSPPCELNPCPGTLSPQAFGYDTQYATSGDMNFAVDLASINTALAVNMGIIPLSNLVSYVADNSRISLLQAMYNAGSISLRTFQNTSSYYEPIYAPMDPIYCTQYDHVNTTSCYVRIGNTLLYPVINHYGWSDTGFDRPTRCTKSASSVAGSAAHYYCNKMDLVTGLIYYPVPTVNITELIARSTWSPTKTPTQNPSPLPGYPTIQPTSSRPTMTPTTRMPTYTKTKKPTAIPTIKPTAEPTAPTSVPSAAPSVPTFEPTLEPTYRRTRRPTAGRRRLENEIEVDELLVPEQDQVDVEGVDLESTSSYIPLYTDDTTSTKSASVPSTSSWWYHSSTSYTFGGSTAGTVSSSSSVSASAASSQFYSDVLDVDGDSFIPLIPQIVDSGKIFNIGKMAAERLAKSLNNDDVMSRVGYDASITTILSQSKASYGSDFKKICSGNNSIASGCAMFAFEVYGGDNRIVNQFLYQPSSTPAFTDTLYAPRTMAVITKRAPTSLVETYYSCVLGVWDSIFQAIGLANSTVQFFVTVGFFLYFYSVVTYLNKIRNKDIEMLKSKKKRLAREAKLREKQLDRVAETFSVMKTRFDALCDDIKSGDRNLRGFERAVLLTELEAEQANVKVNEATETAPAADGYNQVATQEGADGNV